MYRQQKARRSAQAGSPVYKILEAEVTRDADERGAP
tara:strand:- start:294 stop:401 length:108 start_codon:yes stop_codon:yes gene_type:complete